MNLFILSGRLFRDPILREGKDKKPYCFLEVINAEKGTDGKYHDEKVTATINGDRAVNLCKNARKGTWVELQGKITQKYNAEEKKTTTYMSFWTVKPVFDELAPPTPRSEGAAAEGGEEDPDSMLPF